MRYGLLFAGSVNRRRGQVEDLKAPLSESDQVLFEQLLAGLEILLQGEAAKGADAIVGVEGKPVAIGNQDQEEIEQQRLLAEGGDKPIAEKTVRDEAEAAIDTPESLGVEDLFSDHDLGLLSCGI